MRAVRVAMSLKEIGIEAGDVVGVCSDGGEAMCVPLLASAFLNAIAMPFDVNIGEDDLRRLVELVRPPIVFCDARGAAVMRRVLEDTSVPTRLVSFNDDCDDLEPYSSFEREHDGENMFEASSVDDLRATALILLTSGTTGTAKGVCVPQYSVLSVFNEEPIPGAVCWGLTRIYWLIGTLTVFGAIHLGGSWILSSDFSADNLLRVIKQYKVQFLCSAPFYVHEIVRVTTPATLDALSSLRAYMISGNPVGGETLRALKQVAPRCALMQTYALTETVRTVAGVDFGGGAPKDDTIPTCGRVCQGNCVRIVDPASGLDVDGPGCTGELRVKSDYAMSEYYARPDATSDAFDADGYLKTGDLFYYDDDYNFHFVDRVKDLIKYGGIAV